jgi:hypothetical protein
MNIGDTVHHKDYPGTTGKIVARHGGIILVLWDKGQEPGNVNNSMDLKSRCSRHIPAALTRVAS